MATDDRPNRTSQLTIRQKIKYASRKITDRDHRASSHRRKLQVSTAATYWHPTGKRGAKHRALARRLRDRQADCLRFLDPGFGVPWDNNAAEREVRMVKIRQKVSGCLRTLAGARDFTAIRSYLATAVKHGIRFIDALTMLAERQPWLPAIPA